MNWVLEWVGIPFTSYAIGVGGGFKAGLVNGVGGGLEQSRARNLGWTTGWGLGELGWGGFGAGGGGWGEGLEAGLSCISTRYLHTYLQTPLLKMQVGSPLRDIRVYLEGVMKEGEKNFI